MPGYMAPFLMRVIDENSVGGRYMVRFWTGVSDVHDLIEQLVQTQFSQGVDRVRSMPSDQFDALSFRAGFIQEGNKLMIYALTDNEAIVEIDVHVAVFDIDSITVVESTV